MMHNWNNKLNQGLRLMLLVLVAGALVAATGCSWSKHKKVEEKQAVTTPVQAPGTPPNAPPEHLVGTIVPFEAGAVDTVYFDFDKSAVRPDMVEHLDKNVKYLQAHPDYKVYVEGNTDERGTVEYNFSLGQRRADSVKAYLIQKGIPAASIATASKGEENPAKDAAGHNEKSWKQNRRVEFMRIY